MLTSNGTSWLPNQWGHLSPLGVVLLGLESR